jgi:hypothetical protein
MATYIQGVTDYIPQIQPFRPDYNFLGNILQTKQTRYDSAKRQISDLYGSLLNSPLTKDSNIKRRDEFFKAIDQDIKKISGLDLSLQQNVDQAQNVFKGFYDDKYIAADMVWTKKFENSVQKHESLKNCNDPSKCGDLQAWDEGLQELYYKREEFKKSGDKESLNFQSPEYTGYFNWQKKAMTEALDKGYTVSKDYVKGGYKVHDENGKLVQGGLYSLYKNAYGEDPRVNSNYKTKAYVTRKNSIAKMAIELGSEEEAEKAYVQKMMNEGVKTATKQLQEQNDYFDELNSRQLQLEKKDKSGKGLTDAEEEILKQVKEEKERVLKSKTLAQSNIDEITKNLEKGDIRSLIGRVDIATASALEEEDLKNMAITMSKKGEKHELKEDEYTLIKAREAEKRVTNEIEFKRDVYKIQLKGQIDKELEEFKQGIKSGDIPSEEGITLEATPGGTASLDTEDNEEVVFNRNRDLQNKEFTGSQQQSLNMLYNVFLAAKNNASGNNGAAQYLKRVYGDNYDKIKDVSGLKAALDSKKLSPISAFNDVMNLRESKNPTGDVSWAQSVFTNNAEAIQEIKKMNKAALAIIKFNTDNNKKVVDKISAMSGSDNKLAKYAPLLLTKGNMLLHDDEQFVKEYIKANWKDGISVSESDAKSAFKELKKTFFQTYNKTNDISLEEGVNLSGGGTMTANAVLYKGLDPKNKDKYGRLTGRVGDVVNTLTNALSIPGAAKVVIGDASKESLDQDENASVRSALNVLINDALKANAKTADRPVFDAIFSPIAGEDVNQSAITLKFDPETLKKFVGTKENPGVLYKKSTELMDGVTVFFDDNQVQSSFKKGYTKSALETVILQNGEYDIDAFEDTAGKVHFDYDKESGLVNVNWDKVVNTIVNGKLVKTIKTNQNPLKVPLSSIDKVEKDYLNYLKQQQQANMASDAGYAEYKKTKS